MPSSTRVGCVHPSRSSHADGGYFGRAGSIDVLSATTHAVEDLVRRQPISGPRQLRWHTGHQCRGNAMLHRTLTGSDDHRLTVEPDAAQCGQLMPIAGSSPPATMAGSAVPVAWIGSADGSDELGVLRSSAATIATTASATIPPKTSSGVRLVPPRAARHPVRRRGIRGKRWA